MVDSKNIKWYLTLFLLLTGISPYLHSDRPTIPPITPFTTDGNDIGIIFDIPNYITHDPILVIGDDNFTQNGFVGSGTWQSPYILENINITSVDGPALQFINVTRPFVIRSCLLILPVDDSSSVISFENASNWFVDNSTVSGSKTGLSINGCSNIQIINSTIINHYQAAVKADYSLNITVTNNVVTHSIVGLMLMDTNEIKVKDNMFSQLQIGVSGDGVSGIIESNVFEKSSGGVYHSESYIYTTNNSFIDITDAALMCTSALEGYGSPDPSNFPLQLRSYAEFNTFENCSVAFFATFGGESLFANNTILDCDVGVKLEYSAGNQIIGNIIQNCRIYNLWLEHTDLNLIHSNTITGAGLNNALDEDGLNYWDDRTSQGNLWDDYIGPDAYHISGSSNSVDYWPQRYGPPYISGVNETEIVVGTIGVNVTWSAFDSNPSTYTIYVNGIEILSETWNGGNISLPFDSYEVGTYNVTITVMDEEGLTSSHTVIVRVISTYTPLFLLLVVVGSVGLVFCVVFFKKRSTF